MSFLILHNIYEPYSLSVSSFSLWLSVLCLFPSANEGCEGRREREGPRKRGDGLDSYYLGTIYDRVGIRLYFPSL